MLFFIKLSAFLASIIRVPLQFLVKMKVLPEEPIKNLELDPQAPVIYVFRTRSYIHLNLLIFYCKKHKLPSPFGKQNDSQNFVFLSKRASWITKDTRLKSTEENLKRCLSLPDVQLVPVSFHWGRNPGKENSLLRLFFSDQESANLFQRILIMILQGRNSFLIFGEPIDLDEALSKEASIDSKVRKISRIFRVYFHRERIAAMGPLVSHRRQLGHAIVAADPVKQAIKREMSSKNTSFHETTKVARGYFNEIASDYSYTTIRFFSHFLRWLWDKLYDGVRVQHMDRLREVAGGHELIFVPCHRSHMDYLLISYVLYHHGLMIPRIAAGINLNFWPVGGFLRRAGAFYMRRRFAHNKLYTAVFNEYVHTLFNKGYSVEYFIEGGRSRTGRLLQPRTGMISMTLQSILRGTKKPVLFIPTYISYDKVIEVKSYFKELEGKNKKKESVGQILGMRKMLKRSFGQVQVCFGEAIDPLKIIRDNNIDLNSFDPEKDRPSWFTPQVTNLANVIMTQINSTAAISSVAVVSLVMLELPRNALERKELEIQLDLMYFLCHEMPYAPDISLEHASGTEAIQHAMKLGLLQESPHPLGAIAFVENTEATYMHYYRNNVIHLFILPALIASCFHNQPRLHLDSIHESIAAIYPFVKRELFLRWDNSELKMIIARYLSCFVDKGLLLSEDENVYARAPIISLEFSRLRRLASIATSVLERYGVTLTLLSQNSGELTRRQLEEKSFWLSQRISILHAHANPELSDSNLVKIFINELKDQDLLELDEDNKIKPNPLVSELKDKILAITDRDIVHSLQLTMIEAETKEKQEKEQAIES